MMLIAGRKRGERPSPSDVGSGGSGYQNTEKTVLKKMSASSTSDHLLLIIID